MKHTYNNTAKRILAVLLAALMLIGLIACAKDEPPVSNDSGTQATDTSAPQGTDTTPADTDDGEGDENNDGTGDNGTGDNGNGDNNTPVTPPAKRTVYLTQTTEGVAVLGVRRMALETGIPCEWAGSGFEMKVNLPIAGDVTFMLNATGTGSFMIFVDGTAHNSAEGTPYYAVTESTKSIIAKNVPAGDHLISVVRSDDGMGGTATFERAVIPGTHLADALAAKTLYVEFVGDEIALGKGLDGTANGYDATQGFAFQTAVALNAEYSLTALAGQGVTAGDYSFDTSYNMIHPKHRENFTYNFATKADMVVVALGTNDTVSADFEDDYFDLLYNIRQKNGADCKIYCVYSGNTGNSAGIQAACAAIGGEAAGFYTVEWTGVTTAYPTAQQQADFAAVLTARINATKDNAITAEASKGGTGVITDWNEVEENVVLTSYSLASNADKFIQTEQRLEFVATYASGSVYVKATVAKNVSYIVYVNGQEKGIVTFKTDGLLVEIPGAKEAAGENVTIRLIRVDNDADDTITFVDVRLNGTLATASATQNPEGTATNYNITENTGKFNVQGRSTVVDNEITADWSASGIEFDATWIGAIYVQGRGAKQFRVYVNGVETGIVTFGGDTLETKILPGTFCTTETTARIRLVRMEYVKDGLVSMKAVKLDGTIADWTENDRQFIEFVGDSITCGFGSTTQDSSMDGSKTFAYLTAEELDVDYSMVAISGIGVNKSTDQHSGNTMGDFYKYSNYYRNPSLLYAPQKQADLVVVNLNTNDLGRSPTKTEYQADLKALLDDIYSIHGEGVKIVWIVGQMKDQNASNYSSTPVDTWLAEVFTELGGESAGLYIMQATLNNEGGGNHPNYANHQVTAAQLLDLIADKGLLGTTGNN